MDALNKDTIDWIMAVTRAYQAKEAGPALNAADADTLEVLDSNANDATEEQLRGVLTHLNLDEKAELIALSWIGLGEAHPDDWEDAVATARQRIERGDAPNLMEMPTLGDCLAEGLEAIGWSASPDLDLADQPVVASTTP